MATSSPPEKSRGSAKNDRAKTSSARCLAPSGNRSSSSTSAALSPGVVLVGSRERDVEEPEGGVGVDAGQVAQR